MARDLEELDENIELLETQDKKLKEQLEELAKEIRANGEDASTAMFVFLAEIGNTMRAMQKEGIKRQQDVVQERSKLLEKQREQLSKEKRDLVDKLVEEYKLGKKLDEDSLKALNFSKENIEAILQTVSHLEDTATAQPISIFSVLEKVVDETKEALAEKAEEGAIRKTFSSREEEQDKDADKDTIRAPQMQRNRQRA